MFDGERETYRYMSLEGEALFEAGGAILGGRWVERGGQEMVESIWPEPLRWAGAREGEPMSDRDRPLEAVANEPGRGGAPLRQDRPRWPGNSPGTGPFAALG